MLSLRRAELVGDPPYVFKPSQWQQPFELPIGVCPECNLLVPTHALGRQHVRFVAVHTAPFSGPLAGSTTCEGGECEPLEVIGDESRELFSELIERLAWQGAD